MKKLSVSMSTDLFEKIRVLMNNTGITNRSEIICMLIRAGMEEQKRSKDEQVLPNPDDGK